VFDRAASSYGRVGPDFFSDLGALLVEYAAVPAGSKMIDIGAGTGAVSLAASHRLGSSGSVLAIDLAPEMLAQLRQRFVKRYAHTLGDSRDGCGASWRWKRPFRCLPSPALLSSRC
jgi:ubiquinone/menaquinone biosynthesis C-methylase UbiE